MIFSNGLILLIFPRVLAKYILFIDLNFIKYLCYFLNHSNYITEIIFSNSTFLSILFDVQSKYKEYYKW